MSESRLMYVAQRPGNNRDTAAKMAAAARRGREREAARAKQAREWARLGYCSKHGPECDS